MKIHSNKIVNNLLIFLGIFMSAIFIYFRFIRERLPRDIPFNLTILGFIILVEICCIYAYILFVIIKPPKKPNEIIKKIIEAFYTPLELFDTSIKEKDIIIRNYPLWIFYLSNNFNQEKFYKIFDIIFFFLPRIILITTFIIDIFYFGKLFYIYKVIYLGLLLLIRRYILYSIKKFKEKTILELQVNIKVIDCDYEYGIHPSEWPENFDPEDEDFDDVPETMCLPVEIYIKYYSENKIYNNKDIPFNIIFMSSAFYEKYENLSTVINSRIIFHKDSEDYKRKEKDKLEIKELFKKLLQVVILEESYNYSVSKNILFKIMKIIIYSLYLICWMYILYVSFSTLNIFQLTALLNSTLKDIANPFI